MDQESLRLLKSSQEREVVEGVLSRNGRPGICIAETFVPVSKWLTLHDREIDELVAAFLLRCQQSSVILHYEVSDTFLKNFVDYDGDLSLHFSTLTDETARLLGELHCKELRLSGVREISESVANVLSHLSCPLFMYDLERLDDSLSGRRLFSKICDGRKNVTLRFRELTEFQACMLSQFQGEVTLDDLVAMPDTPAHIALAKKGVFRRARLCLQEIGIQVAFEVSKEMGKLDLRFLKELPESVGHLKLAEKLVNEPVVSYYSPAALLFLDLQLLSPEAARILSRFDGELTVNGSTHSEDVFRELSQHQGNLSLGLEDLSETAAALLSKHGDGNLEIRCEKLSDAALEALSNHYGNLILRLDRLSELGAASLSRHLGGSLEIECNEYSDSAFEALSHRTGALTLHVAELSDTAAKNLSQYAGDVLEIECYEDLSDSIFESLSKFKGHLAFLQGINLLTDAAAASLAKHKGTLELKDLRSLSDNAARLLCRHYKTNLKIGFSSVSNTAKKIFEANEIFSNIDDYAS